MSDRSLHAASATARALRRLVPSEIGALGVDVVDIEDFTNDLDADPSVFLASVFLDSEVLECDGQPDRLATRFAAKEATLKALGTGARGIGMTDVEVCTAPEGAPFVRLTPAAALVAERAGIRDLHVSVTRDAGLAIAVVVGTIDQLQHNHERQGL
ncbi:MAG: holo-ACP synthase [Actinomycetota bacterium]|nr:holo-ACP synthase [Actinomycetota bacterium]